MLRSLTSVDIAKTTPTLFGQLADKKTYMSKLDGVVKSIGSIELELIQAHPLWRLNLEVFERHPNKDMLTSNFIPLKYVTGIMSSWMASRDEIPKDTPPYLCYSRLQTWQCKPRFLAAAVRELANVVHTKNTIRNVNLSLLMDDNSTYTCIVSLGFGW